MGIEKELRNPWNWFAGISLLGLLTIGSTVIYDNYNEKRILENPKCIREVIIQRKDTLTDLADRIKKDDKENQDISNISVDSLTYYIAQMNHIKNHGRILAGNKIKLPRYSESGCLSSLPSSYNEFVKGRSR